MTGMTKLHGEKFARSLGGETDATLMRNGQGTWYVLVRKYGLTAPDSVEIVARLAVTSLFQNVMNQAADAARAEAKARNACLECAGGEASPEGKCSACGGTGKRVLQFEIPAGRDEYDAPGRPECRLPDMPDFAMYSPQGDKAVANMVKAAKEAGIELGDEALGLAMDRIEAAGHGEVFDTAVKDELAVALDG